MICNLYNKDDMINSCGIFIVDSNGEVLICRPTGIKTKDGWSIPKGKKEKDEEIIDAAIRECREECGLDLSAYKKKLKYMGDMVYKNKKKRLHAFMLFLDFKIDVTKLVCECKIDDKRPEIDMFEMVTPKEAIKRVHYTQGRLLEKYWKFDD
jgi:8-oxo-dGTP pyrophosphatase MutT (NUDIX family)